MFEDQTFDVIMERMLTKFDDTFDKRQGSVIYDLLAPAAIELELAYQQLSILVEQAFLRGTDTPPEFLELRATEVGISRNPALSSTGVVIFTGTEGTVIPSDTRVSTNDTTPIYFKTIGNETIGASGTAEATVEAESGGISGNVGANTITELDNVIEGVISVNNTNALTGGLDAENDDSLYTRYIERVSSPSSSGNVADYIRWAKEVRGIGFVRVFPLFNGPGTVKVVVITEEKRSPSPQLLTSVTEYIETNRPLLANVTVKGADERNIDIDVDITLKVGGTLENAGAQIQSTVSEYLAMLAFSEQVVRYSKIGEAILNAEDVLDYQNLTINNSTGNVQLTEEEIAVLGKINLI